MLRPFAIDHSDFDHAYVSSINHADVKIHTSCTFDCLQRLNASTQPAADPETLRMMDDEYEIQPYHQLKYLGSLHRLNPTWEEKNLVRDLDAIQARMEADHCRIMEVRKQEEERQGLLKMNEIWEWVREQMDDLDKATSRRKKVAFSGVGAGAGADADAGTGTGVGGTCDAQQVRRLSEANAKVKTEAKMKAKTKGSEKVASGIHCDIWVERTRGGLCMVRKRSERKKN